MRKTGQSKKFLMDCIAQALLQLMQDKDYGSISISEICRKAGVGRTTFYHHFTEARTKDDVLVYYAVSLWDDYCEPRKDQAEQDSWGTLMNFIYDNRSFFSVLKKAQLDHILFSIFYKTMGPSKEDIPEVALFKSFFAGGVIGITYNWVETGFRKTPDELADGIAKIQEKQNSDNI